MAWRRTTMRTLGIIPARGGSKGIPRKNLKLLCGKPLLQYTAAAALQARQLSRVVLTTEDEEIADVGRSLGLDVPFIRPADLARDDTPTLPVLQHAVEFLEKQGERFEAVCLLQPTNPLCSARIIDQCIQMLKEGSADAVVTILPVPTEYNPHWVYFQRENGTLKLSTGKKSPIPRRQELPVAFHREGSVYVTRRDVVMEQNSLYGEHLLGCLISSDSSVNIDRLEDLERAELLISSKTV